MNTKIFRILTIAAFLFLVGEMNGQQAEPEKLVKLRSSWTQANARTSAPLLEFYLKGLQGLQNSLTREGQLQDAVLVRAEITRISKEDVDGTAKAETGSPGSQLQELSKKFDVAMADALVQNNTIYLRELGTMKTDFAKAGDLDSALAVSGEIKKLAPDGAAGPAEAAALPGDLPRTSRQLGKYLINTDWFLRDGNLKFRANDWMDMPWHPCDWEVIDGRNVMMKHPEKAWKHRVTFSEDMKKFVVIEGGKASGKKMWEGEFVRRLTEEEAKDEKTKRLEKEKSKDRK